MSICQMNEIIKDSSIQTPFMTSQSPQNILQTISPGPLGLACNLNFNLLIFPLHAPSALIKIHSLLAYFCVFFLIKFIFIGVTLINNIT